MVSLSCSYTAIKLKVLSVFQFILSYTKIKILSKNPDYLALKIKSSHLKFYNGILLRNRFLNYLIIIIYIITCR